jgi:hypothetical protein
MKDLLSGKTIDGKNFAISSVRSSKDIIPFPLNVVDMSTTPVIKKNPQEYIGIRQQTPASQLISSMNETGIWNIVQFSQADIEQKLKVASRIIQDPKTFLDSPGREFFESSASKGEKYKGQGENRFAFRASSQKRYILNMINSYVFSLAGAKTLIDPVLAVADELFTNALYNAPFGDKEYSLDRSTMVFLDPALSPEMIVAHNSKHLFLGCLDHFGSFDCEEFLKRSSKMTKLVASDFLKLDVGGAGFGMLRIIDLAPDVFVVVEKNKQTFIGCLFPLNVSSKKIKEASRNLCFKSFETFGREPNTVVVEKRGSNVLLKFKGKIETGTPLREMSLEGASKVSFDMRLVDQISGEEFGKFISSLQKIETLEKISFDFLHSSLVSQIVTLVATNPKLIEIGSLWETAECAHCKTVQNIVMKPVDNEKVSAIRDSFECPSCGTAF